MAARQGKAHDYDLARGLRFYDGGSKLSERAAALWGRIDAAEMEIAREFWRRYRRSEELKEQIGDDQIEALAKKIVPYLRDKFLRLNDGAWAATARGFVEKALAANLSL